MRNASRKMIAATTVAIAMLSAGSAVADTGSEEHTDTPICQDWFQASGPMVQTQTRICGPVEGPIVLSGQDGAFRVI